MATNRRPLTEERRVTIRLAAQAMAVGPSGSDLMDWDVFEATRRGLPVILAEWESPNEEIQERLAYHVQRGSKEAVILIRRNDHFLAMLSHIGSDVPHLHIRGDEVSPDTPIGEVWDVLEHIAKNAEWVPSQFAPRVPRVNSDIARVVGSFAMSLA